MRNRGVHLSSSRLAAFVSPEAPLSAFLMVVVVFIPPFYAGSMGLGLSVVGAAFGLTKLWDVITDPAFGVLSDRTHTRWGRRRPWLIVSLPVLVICTYFVFAPSPPVTGSYFIVWMILLYVGWTLASVSHISWAAELSSDYHERSRISAFKQGAGLIGAIGLMALVAYADQQLGYSERERLELVALALMVLLPLSFIAAIWAAPETGIEKTSVISPSDKPFRVLLSNKPLRLLLVTNLLLGMAAGSVGGMFLFFVEDVLRLGEWASIALLPWFVSGLLFLPLCMWLSRKFGKHRALCIALAYYMLVSLSFVFVPEENVVFICVALLFMGANQAVNTYIPAAIMADVTDLDAVHTGRNRTGLYMSLLQTSSKVAAALAVGLSYPILSVIGFDAAPDAVNSKDTLDQLRWMLVLFPGALYLIVLGIMWNFPLTEEHQVELKKKLHGGEVKSDLVNIL